MTQHSHGSDLIGAAVDRPTLDLRLVPFVEEVKNFGFATRRIDHPLVRLAPIAAMVREVLAAVEVMTA